MWHILCGDIGLGALCMLGLPFMLSLLGMEYYRRSGSIYSLALEFDRPRKNERRMYGWFVWSSWYETSIKKIECGWWKRSDSKSKRGKKRERGEERMKLVKIVYLKLRVNGNGREINHSLPHQYVFLLHYISASSITSIPACWFSFLIHASCFNENTNTPTHSFMKFRVSNLEINVICLMERSYRFAHTNFLVRICLYQDFCVWRSSLAFLELNRSVKIPNLLKKSTFSWTCCWNDKKFFINWK